MLIKEKIELVRTTTQNRFPYLIEISNENFETMYFANSTYDIEYNDKVYKSCEFSISGINRQQNKTGDTSLEISAIDQFWIEKIRAYNNHSKIKFIAVMEYEEVSENTEGVIVTPIEEVNFTLTKASWTDTKIQWAMIFDEVMNISVPCDIAYSCNCPGCA